MSLPKRITIRRSDNERSVSDENFGGLVTSGRAAFRENHSFIQITAPISPGSSGSPVLDEDGKVIGVATLIEKEGQNLNFAIPVEKVSEVLASQGIALPENPSRIPGLSNGAPVESPTTAGVLMVTAKSTNVTFQEQGGFLVFLGNGRSVSASIAKPESTDIGHWLGKERIYLSPGLTRSSTGEWYLPYPLALTIQAFLYPSSIRPEFAPDHFYLINASGSQESQKTQSLMNGLSKVGQKLFMVPEPTEQLPTLRAIMVFVKIIPSQTDGPDCAVIAHIPAPPGPLEKGYAWIEKNVQLASIFAEQILHAFTVYSTAVSSVSGRIDVWEVPPRWDIPIIGIDFQLTEAAYSRLSKDHFNEIASALVEGLKMFKTEITPLEQEQPSLEATPASPGRNATQTPPSTPAIDAKSFGRNLALAFNNQGLVYERERKFDKAISEFTAAIQVDSNFAQAYFNLGNAYFDLGDHDNAIVDYNEAIRLDPKYTPAYYNRGTAYLHKGNRAKANADFATARRLKAGQ
jgi:hypothetical protein